MINIACFIYWCKERAIRKVASCEQYRSNRWPMVFQENEL